MTLLGLQNFLPRLSCLSVRTTSIYTPLVRKFSGENKTNSQSGVEDAEFRKWFDEGLRTMGSDLSAAVSAFSRAIELNPRHAFSFAGRAQAYSMFKQLDLAAEDFKAALKLNPNVKEWHCGLGDVYARLRKGKEAIACFTSAIQIDPSYEVAYYGRGILRTNAFELEEAESDFMKVIEINPQHKDGWIRLLSVYDEMQAYDKAVEVGNKIESLFPDFDGGYYGKGIAYMGAKQFEKAVSEFTASVELGGSYKLMSLVFRADSNRALGNVEAAAKDYESVIELDPNQLYACEMLGDIYLQTQRAGQAADLFTYILDKAPKYDGVCRARALAFMEIGDFVNAEVDLFRVLKSYPKDGWVYWQLGRLYSAQKMNEEAIKYLEKAVEMGQNGATGVDLATAYFMERDRVKCENVLKKVMDENSDDLTAYTLSSLLHFTTGKFRESIALLDKAVDRFGEQHVSLGLKGFVLAHMGNYADGLEHCSAAIRLNPEVAQLYYQRGTISLLMGNFTASIEDCNKAIELDPAYPSALGLRAVSNILSERWDGVDEDIMKAFASDEGTEEALLASGLVQYIREKNTSSAVGFFSEAIQAFPGGGLAFYYRGILRIDLGEKSEGLQDLKKAAELFSHDPFYRDQYEYYIAEHKM